MENNLHETCVNFEVAKMLKTAGFDWDCKYVYDLMFPTSCKDNKVYDDYSSKNPNRFTDLVSAPTLEVAQKWLREVKGIIFTIEAFVVDKNDVYKAHTVYTCRFFEVPGIAMSECETYEETQAAGIQTALEMLLKK